MTRMKIAIEILRMVAVVLRSLTIEGMEGRKLAEEKAVVHSQQARPLPFSHNSINSRANTAAKETVATMKPFLRSENFA